MIRIKSSLMSWPYTIKIRSSGHSFTFWQGRVRNKSRQSFSYSKKVLFLVDLVLLSYPFVFLLLFHFLKVHLFQFEQALFVWWINFCYWIASESFKLFSLRGLFLFGLILWLVGIALRTSSGFLLPGSWTFLVALWKHYGLHAGRVIDGLLALAFVELAILLEFWQICLLNRWCSLLALMVGLAGVLGVDTRLWFRWQAAFEVLGVAPIHMLLIIIFVIPICAIYVPIAGRFVQNDNLVRATILQALWLVRVVIHAKSVHVVPFCWILFA